MPKSTKLAILVFNLIFAGISSADEDGKMASTVGSEKTIREVQERLRAEGYGFGPTDGKVGPKTADAIREFQTKQGLHATGQLDNRTLNAIRSAKATTKPQDYPQNPAREPVDTDGTTDDPTRYGEPNQAE